MPRSVKEWIGKDDNTPIPARVKSRISEAQGDKCALCGKPFWSHRHPFFDHIIALINGGQNRETNLQAICFPCHAHKTKQDLAIKSKIARIRKKVLGIKAKPRNPIPGSRASKFKKRMNGEVVRR